MQKGDLIGPIVRLQVQLIPIKVRGEGYLPDQILSVDRAVVDAWGMIGFDDGKWVIDAHHKSHPSRRGGGRRPLSIGFTGHYALMEERFAVTEAGGGGASLESTVDFLRREFSDGVSGMDDPRVRDQLADWYIQECGINNFYARLLTGLSQGQLPGPPLQSQARMPGPLR